MADVPWAAPACRRDPVALKRLLEITGGEIEFVDGLVDTYLEDAVA